MMELSIVLKATVVLAIGLAAAHSARRASASVRHLLLASTFAALVMLPLGAVLVSPITVELPILAADPAPPATDTAGRPFATGRPAGTAARGNLTVTLESLPSATVLLRSAWTVGALTLIAWLGVGFWQLGRLRAQGIPWIEGSRLADAIALASGIRRSIDVQLHEGVTAPLTCGVLRPVVVLPLEAREWGEAEVRRALVHELEHVRRGDWATHVVARIVCAAYWFHPLVWVAARQLGVESERACDDAVLQHAEGADYAEQLVTLARRLSASHAQPALSMASRSDLSVRIRAVLDAAQRRGRAGKATASTSLVAAGLIAVVLAPMHAVLAQQRPTGRSGLFTSVPLVEAAQDGDRNLVRDLLDGGADVNTVVLGDGTPLIVASREGKSSIVRLLLDRGADPDLGVLGDGNPLIMAAREGHTDIVEMLLDRGASIDRIVPDDENALIMASREGHLDIVTLLIARGADVNARAWAQTDFVFGEWRTPLNMARRSGHQDVVTALRAAGARE